VGQAIINQNHEWLDFNLGKLKSVFSTEEQGSEAITFGDSGGGWFNAQGQLIGVSLGAKEYYRNLRNSTYWDEYFSPLIIPQG
jgi:S1-C subfamily serine protease